jgi:hypothetical protein
MSTKIGNPPKRGRGRPSNHDSVIPKKKARSQKPTQQSAPEHISIIDLSDKELEQQPEINTPEEPIEPTFLYPPVSQNESNETYDLASGDNPHQENILIDTFSAIFGEEEEQEEQEHHEHNFLPTTMNANTDSIQKNTTRDIVSNSSQNVISRSLQDVISEEILQSGTISDINRNQQPQDFIEKVLPYMIASLIPYLSSKDLKFLRLTCKSFRDLLKPYIFVSLNILNISKYFEYVSNSVGDDFFKIKKIIFKPSITPVEEENNTFKGFLKLMDKTIHPIENITIQEQNTLCPTAVQFFHLIKKLELHKTNLLDPSFTLSFLKCKQLENLTIKNCKVTNEQLKFFPETLETLIISHCSTITSFIFNYLPSSLKTFRLVECKHIVLDEMLIKLPNLNELMMSVNGFLLPQTFSYLPTSLKILNLNFSEDCKIFPGSFSKLPLNLQILKLRKLTFNECIFNDLPDSLSYILIRSCLLYNVHSNNVIKYPSSLETLVISESSIPYPYLEALLKVPTLKSLSILKCDYIDGVSKVQTLNSITNQIVHELIKRGIEVTIESI